MNRVLNSHWWAKALIDHRTLEITEHAGERAHQKLDPEAIEPHRDDHELTAWEKAWIQARISDAHFEKARAGDAAAAILAEPHEEHEARELAAQALHYFGGSHEETRAKFETKRAEHQKGHDSAHLIQHRPDPDSKLAPISAEAAAAIRAQHVQSIEQIDTYLAPGSGLIDRHIATVKMEVAEARRVAKTHVDDAELILSVPFVDHVAVRHLNVRDEIRAHVWAQQPQEVAEVATEGAPIEETALDAPPSEAIDVTTMLAEMESACAPLLTEEVPEAPADAEPDPLASDAEYDEPETVASDDASSGYATHDEDE